MSAAGSCDLSFFSLEAVLKTDLSFAQRFVMRVCSAIFALLLITSPTELWARSDQFTTCIANLKQIDGTAYRYMDKAGLSETNSYSLSDPALLAGFKDGVLPRCPSGGSYMPGATFSHEPACSVHGTIEQIGEQIRARIRRERMKQFITFFGMLVVGGGLVFMCGRLLARKQG